MEEEYRLIGKGKIMNVVSSEFLLVASRGEFGIFNGSNGKYGIKARELDSSAIYSQKGQRLKISGKDSQALKEVLESELKKSKIKIKPIKR